MAETVRDAFEEWAHADHRRLEPNEYEADDRTPGNNHYYDADTTNQAYIGWCAAWNRSPTDPAMAELVEALGAILADIRVFDCDHLHHTKKDLHKAGPCPVEIRLEAAISRAHTIHAKHAAKP